jgi:hypothetical protein
MKAAQFHRGDAAGFCVKRVLKSRWMALHIGAGLFLSCGAWRVSAVFDFMSVSKDTAPMMERSTTLADQNS